MKNKKLLSTFLTAMLALSSATSVGVVVSEAATSADSSDLKGLDESMEYKYAALNAAGIVQQLYVGYFGRPSDLAGLDFWSGALGEAVEGETAGSLSRAEFAKVAALIFNLKVDSSLKTSSFIDVKSDDPSIGDALPYIEALKKAGITTGIGDGTFDPAGNVTKEQLAAFFVRGLGMEDEAKESKGTGDETVSSWAQGYVDVALKNGIQVINTIYTNFSGREPVDYATIFHGAFETKKLIEVSQPLEVSGAEFVSGNKLVLTLTTQVDLASIDLSKIIVNGVPLDSSIDSFGLSEDKKTIIIKLHNGFQLDTTKPPVIEVNGLKTLFGNDLKNDDDEVRIPVKVTEPPSIPTPAVPDSSATPEPVDPTPAPVDPTPEPVNPTPVPVDPTPEPVDPTPAPVDPTPEPVNPTPAPVDPTPEPVNPPPVPVDPNPAPVNPNPVPVDPNPAPVNPNPGTPNPNQNPLNPNS